jgi:hypothetical protein
MQPHTSWFQLLASSPGPVLFPAPTAVFTETPCAQPHAGLALDTGRLPSAHIHNNAMITNLSSVKPLSLNSDDPWTRAHLRACVHASDECTACSIAIICCSCCSLRFTPGPPPMSPKAATHHSRSASPTLFRDLGNHSPPPNFDSWSNTHDDDAYARALAECDTCDNSSCPRGHDEPASWTIIVEQFDEGSEEFFDRTFRACTACNHSCKKTFMSHRIKSRHFDNSSKAAVVPSSGAQESAGSNAKETTTPNDVVTTVGPHLTPGIPWPASPSTSSRPITPLEIFSVVAQRHRTSCAHIHSACPTCAHGITCCACKNLHTAPARLRLHCIICSHFACVTCTTPFCCSCRKFWFPGDAPTTVLANRFRGGARSTKSSKKGSSSLSQSSGPGSLVSAVSCHASPDPFATKV